MRLAAFQLKKRRKLEASAADDDDEDEIARAEQEEADWHRKASSTLVLLDNVALARSLQDQGAILAEAGRFREALDRFDSAARRDPTSATAHEQVRPEVKSAAGCVS